MAKSRKKSGKNTPADNQQELPCMRRGPVNRHDSFRNYLLGDWLNNPVERGGPGPTRAKMFYDAYESPAQIAVWASEALKCLVTEANVKGFMRKLGLAYRVRDKPKPLTPKQLQQRERAARAKRVDVLERVVVSVIRRIQTLEKLNKLPHVKLQSDFVRSFQARHKPAEAPAEALSAGE